MKTMTLDQSVKIEGASGRNMFSDSEKAGDLRVGAAWSTPGIYSQKGDVIVGSQSENVWLYGKVAITKEGNAQQRNQPETLYVDGGIKANAAVDGNMKVVYQRDDQPQTTYEKPLWRYHMSLTAPANTSRTKTIPEDILIALCGKPDGCEVRLGRTRWSDNETASFSKIFHFSYNSADKHFEWNADVTRGEIKPGNIYHIARQDDFFTTETFVNNQSKGSIDEGIQLLLYKGGNPKRMCEVTPIP
jgi:hypothetical protein